MQDIRIKNISKAYGDKQVLNHISKEFPSGETTVLMGVGLWQDNPASDSVRIRKGGQRRSNWHARAGSCIVSGRPVVRGCFSL